MCPESPVWLEWKGNTQAAAKARKRLQGHEDVTGAAAHDGAPDAESQTAVEADADDEAVQPLRPQDSTAYSEDQAPVVRAACFRFYCYTLGCKSV